RGRAGRRGAAGRSRGAGRVEIGVEGRHSRRARFVLVNLVQEGGSYKRSQRTNMNGSATFLNVPEGTYRAELIEPGYVYTRKGFELGLDASAQVALFEPKGRRASIQVFDQDGFPAAFVRIRFLPEDGPAHVSVDRHEVQHSPLYTDRRGRLRVEHLPRSRVKVEARRGSSWADGELGKDESILTLHLTR
ncbi:MAG: hypothetical protein O7C98_00005, partial [Planctomycetota bacterium]|nr:hypothetical protein [Planctomycetota bacterium]